MAEDSSRFHSHQIWFVAIVLLALVAYELYSGLVFKKVGVPGIFEIEFADRPRPELAEHRKALPECDITNAWKIVQAHRGSATDALDDVIAFQKLVLEIGCVQHPYSLDLAGKQNLNRFAITVTGEYTSTAANGKTYHYKESNTTLDVGGRSRHASSKARRVLGADEPWEIFD